MTSRFKLHKERQNKVVGLLDETIEFCKKYDLDKLKESFDHLKESTVNEEFIVVVVGEFSAGKSTFLNALMGNWYLPSATKETTATVNFLKHISRSEDNNNVHIHYVDDTMESVQIDNLTVDSLKKYVSTDGDNVAKKIKKVDIYLESKFLEDNVTLVDSPGLNGVLEGHKDITMDQIEKSHACIFMFDANQPGKQTDFDFLKKIKDKTDNLFFLINKIDQINEEEGETVASVSDKVKESYSGQFTEEKSIPKIYGISAFKALVGRNKKPISFYGRKDRTEDEKMVLVRESLIEEFEDRLYKYLSTGEKTRDLLLEPIERIDKTLQANFCDFEEQEQMLNGERSAEELEEQIAQIKSHKIELEDILIGKEKEIKRKLKEIQNNTSKLFRQKTREAEERASSIANSFNINQDNVSNISKSSDRIIKKIKNTISYEINDVYEYLSSSIENEIDDIESEILDDYTLDINCDLEVDIESLKQTHNVIVEEQKEYQDKIKELRKKKNQLKQDAVDFECDAIEYDELKDQIANIKREEQKIRSSINPHNSTNKEKRTRQVKKKRGGVWGAVAFVFAGPKRVDEEYYEYVRNRDYDEFEQNRSEKATKYRKESSELNGKLKEFSIKKRQNDKNSIQLEDVECEEQELRSKLESIYENKNQRLSSSIDSIKDDFISQVDDFISSGLRKAKDDFNGVMSKRIKDIQKQCIEEVSNSIREKLQSAEEDINRKQKQLEDAAKDKAKRLNQIGEIKGAIKELQCKAVDYKAEIANSDVDKIEYEEIV